MDSVMHHLLALSCKVFHIANNSAVYEMDVNSELEKSEAKNKGWIVRYPKSTTMTLTLSCPFRICRRHTINS
jgi:hypothetical protein